MTQITYTLAEAAGILQGLIESMPWSQNREKSGQ